MMVFNELGIWFSIFFGFILFIGILFCIMDKLGKFLDKNTKLDFNEQSLIFFYVVIFIVVSVMIIGKNIIFDKETYSTNTTENIKQINTTPEQKEETSSEAIGKESYYILEEYNKDGSIYKIHKAKEITETTNNTLTFIDQSGSKRTLYNIDSKNIEQIELSNLNEWEAYTVKK